MKIVKMISYIFLLMLFIFCFGFTVSQAINFVNTDYIHEFKQDINNLLDDNIDTYFTLPDFTNYLEFKLESHSGISDIELVFDDTKYDYKYKIYSSNDGYTYNEVVFDKEIIDSNTEIIHVDIKDVYVRLRVLSSGSEDYIHIKDINFFNKNGSRINNVEIEKDDPVINEYKFQIENVYYKDAIKGLISRTLGEEYVNFFDSYILPDDKGKDYFVIYTENDKVILKGNNINSISVALNYYFEHYLKQTFERFGSSKIKVTLPFPQIDGIVEKSIDMKYRYNYNYVAYGYTMAYWTFNEWEREIDWMALNGFNMALNLVGHEEVVRRFLKEFGFSFSEIVDYLTSPVYLPWQFMGNITSIGGELTPKWFEDRAKLSIDIQKRMLEFGIEPIHQMFIGYFPYKENSGVNVINGGYWSKIKGPDRLDFNNNDVEFISRVYYEKQRELLGKSKYFAGDLFHEGANLYGYDAGKLSNKVLSLLKDNAGEDSIWIIQSWSHNPSSDSIEDLNKDNILILDLHSQLNTRWKGISKFNYMSWNNKEFDNSNWIFGILNNFGGRNGLYGHANHLLSQFYDAKYNSEYLSGIAHTSEAIGFNNFIDELSTELIFSDEVNMDEFVKRYLRNRYGKNDEDLLEAFNILLDTVYNPVTDIYHEGASESIINARPSLEIESASKWGSIHKNYDSEKLEKVVKIYISKYDEFKGNEGYIVDLIDIASEVIINLASEYYQIIQSYYNEGNIESLQLISKKFLNLILLQANILYYNEQKSLKKVINKLDSLDYDDYFKDTLKYNKKTLLTTWYDKLVSEDDGLRDYANTDFYDIIGTLYYNRWKRFFDGILSDELNGFYDDYRFDIKWINDDNSLNFNRSDKSLNSLIDLLLVEIGMYRNDFSFLGDLIYSINDLF